jgi:peptidoglycan/xylan/chitin deacetylase (PgdA/CDA1 family)
MRLAIAAIAVVLVAAACTPERPVVRKETPSEPTKPPIATTANFAVPVLMYHRIDRLTESEQKSPLARDLTVSPEDFEAQVKLLVDNGFSILTVDDVQAALLNHTELPERAVAITMDDGYQDNFDQAFPILKKYGVPATIFLVGQTVETPRHLSWSNIAEMSVAGVRYGSHTMSHPDLPLLTDDRLDHELKGSKDFFEAKLGETVDTLAYPAGRFDDRVVTHVQLAGYRTAWDKGGGPVMPGDDPFRLPRVRVNGSTTLEDFKRKVWSGHWAIRMGAERVTQRPHQSRTL